MAIRIRKGKGCTLASRRVLREGANDLFPPLPCDRSAGTSVKSSPPPPVFCDTILFFPLPPYRDSLRLYRSTTGTIIVLRLTSHPPQMHEWHSSLALVGGRQHNDLCQATPGSISATSHAVTDLLGVIVLAAPPKLPTAVSHPIIVFQRRCWC